MSRASSRFAKANWMPAIAPKHVLVVDDHPDAAESLAELLRLACPFDITVDVGLNGAEAIALARAHPPAIAILDIDMPVLNGIDTAHAIRSLPTQPPPLLVGMSGRLFHSTAMSTRLAFDHFCIKPTDIDALVALVAAA